MKSSNIPLLALTSVRNYSLEGDASELNSLGDKPIR